MLYLLLKIVRIVCIQGRVLTNYFVFNRMKIHLYDNWIIRYRFMHDRTNDNLRIRQPRPEGSVLDGQRLDLSSLAV
jgi:hypothetical protein